jgi:hypothetical protein
VRRFFVVLIVLVAVVAAIGFYRGWFDVSWEKTDGKGQLTGTVNEDKIEADKKKALENVKDLGHKKPPASDTSKDRDTSPK